MTHYHIPARETRTELRIQKSRFITTAAPAFTIEQARQFIARIKAEFPDASHNVPAYLIGFGASVIAHSSDDGEPSGTAGRPALVVLSNSGLGDIAVVVTRYFGGIKLGAGGLVRAYTESVQQVLAALPIARKTPTHTAKLVLPYRGYNFAKSIIEKHEGRIENQEFAADVSFTFEMPVQSFANFQSELERAAQRKIELQILHTEDKIHPIK
ncbi:MAG: YigZ family protein [Anaerolineae bacterium]|nr:YigZ family protein [Anaerolineae bacterium]